MKRLRNMWIALVALFSVNLCYADMDSNRVQFEPSGVVNLNLGQLVRGRRKQYSEDIRKIWTQKLITGFYVKAILSQRSMVKLGAEMQMFNEFPREDPGVTRQIYFYPYLHEAALYTNFINTGDRLLKFGIGYFPFKYNNDVSNLGEYLFRTGNYPQYIMNFFDWPCARLMGMHLDIKPVKGLHIDALAYSNFEWIGVHDLNLGLIASYNLFNVFELGAGITANSVISADKKATTPLEDYGQLKYLTDDGDTAHYTFKGSKFMWRASLDIKKLFPPTDFFSEEDLKIYTEGAILGLKNYPLSLDSTLRYDYRNERIPVMWGLNWPTHPLLSYTIVPLAAMVPAEMRFDNNFTDKEKKVAFITGGTGIVAGAGSFILEKLFQKHLRLDKVSIEVEYFGCKYPNDLSGIAGKGVPIPFPFMKSLENYPDSTDYTEKDNWKWSVYAIKTINNRYRFSFQVASDHLRSVSVNWQLNDLEEAIRKLNHWYYFMSLAVLF